MTRPAPSGTANSSAGTLPPEAVRSKTAGRCGSCPARGSTGSTTCPFEEMVVFICKITSTSGSSRRCGTSPRDTARASSSGMTRGGRDAQHLAGQRAEQVDRSAASSPR